jgi:hypothetical protein
VKLLRRDAKAASLELAAKNRGEGFNSNNQSNHYPYYALHIRRGDFQYKEVSPHNALSLYSLNPSSLIVLFVFDNILCILYVVRNACSYASPLDAYYVIMVLRLIHR